MKWFTNIFNAFCSDWSQPDGAMLPVRMGHTWISAAFDAEFQTSTPDNNRRHLCRWMICADCGKRRFDYDGGQRNPVIVQAATSWLQDNEIHMSRYGILYLLDYQLTHGAGKQWHKYEYQPITGPERILHKLKQDAEFSELHKHQMVADALSEFETVLKLHKDIDKTS